MFNETKSYTRLMKLYGLYRWFKLATCELTLNAHLVTQCSEEDDVIKKVNDLLQKLNHPTESGRLYFGLSLPDVTSRCHDVTSASDVTINSVPVTLETGATMVEENCEENQIFAPIYQKCLEITCPEGSDLIGQECTVIPNSEVERAATLIACGISVSCLIVVLLVYGLVPDLRNVPGKIVMSMSSALLVAQMMFLFCTHPQGLACEIYAAVHHAVWLASFSWLAAMSLHLACILHVQSQRWFNPSSSAIFYVFSSLCWGLPSLIAGSCFTLDKTGTVQINYGINGVCWIGNFKSIIAVFIVPMFLLLSINAICAVFVIKAIRKSSNFRQKNSQHKREKTQLVLCVNLSLMMGLTWVFYFLAVAMNTSCMWVVFILTNGSQGLYVFLCYLARKSVLAKLIGMLRRFKPIPPNITDAIDLTRSTTLWTLPLTDQVPRFSPRTYVYTVNP
ncbi:adhesion G-protein coupled receptor D1-like [Physella acuta]|uniref:adhesion G-protein coupled receptor D1-like n=1 Tax=Physella acuta TaxID=109671 RepID=UPI0027DD28E7|nr:adhesion G-protein coupled receptor D1-like [Physella acuta]